MRESRQERRNLKKQRLKIAKKYLSKPPGEFIAFTEEELKDAPGSINRAFRNNRYIVMINDQHPTSDCFALRAMIQRVDNRPIPNHWSEIQEIKSKLFGEGSTAIEYYPPKSELVDDANIYWIWLFPEGYIPKPIL